MPNMADTTETPEILRQAPAGRVVLWTGEVATLAGVTAMTVTRWARSGRLPSSTTDGGNRRYTFGAVAELLADLGRPVPWWLHGAAQAVADSVGSADLDELAGQLRLIEAWLAEDSGAAEADDMALVIRRAWRIVEDLAEAAGGTP